MTRQANGPDRVKPILLLEINEVPWKLLDLYRRSGGFPHISRFFESAETYTTVTADTGHLSPWVTWPSMHRGMPDHEHGILNLGQDPATFKGTAIWEEYRGRGHSIGVCGSLQSWPPVDPGPKGFYLPDTFSHDARTIPAYLGGFQKFNLNQVRKNGRVVSGHSMFTRDALRLAASLPRLGISRATLWETAKQLVRERRDSTFVARRPVFQAMLYWDIFKSLYKPSDPPAFSTFFTNHIAGLMHRYWHHIFPEDFGDLYRKGGRKHKATMDFAMGLLDRILADAMDFAEMNGELRVVFASSMGQAAILRPDHEGYAASVPELDTLMAAFGIPVSRYEKRIAMVPHIAAEIADPGDRAAMAAALRRCQSQSGERVFKVQEIGNSLSIVVRTPKAGDIAAGGFSLAKMGQENTGFISWDRAGIVMNKVDAGTGYHVPQGVFARYRRDGGQMDARAEIGADRVKSLLMEWSGLPAGEPDKILAVQNA